MVTVTSTTWGDGVAKVTTAGWGSFTNYRLPNATAKPQGIMVGLDNNLWFTESGASKLGRLTTTGQLVEFSLGAGSKPQQIVSGPDGALWFTETGTNQIGRVTLQGAVTELAIATPLSQPVGITRGSDGKLWFTEQSGNRVGYVEV